jgi:hypothetical protein
VSPARGARALTPSRRSVPCLHARRRRSSSHPRAARGGDHSCLSPWNGRLTPKLRRHARFASRWEGTREVGAMPHGHRRRGPAALMKFSCACRKAGTRVPRRAAVPRLCLAAFSLQGRALPVLLGKVAFVNRLLGVALLLPEVGRLVMHLRGSFVLGALVRGCLAVPCCGLAILHGGQPITRCLAAVVSVRPRYRRLGRLPVLLEGVEVDPALAPDSSRPAIRWRTPAVRSRSSAARSRSWAYPVPVLGTLHAPIR